ncbi:hypothetical protein [Treponema brennaborense]|nr:hypothetical protein [Treponema brennaborense]
MTDTVVSELVILVLLLIVNFRVFIRKRSQRDAVVVLAPLALVLSVLLCFAWKPDLPILAVCVLSLFVCVINVHSLTRLVSRLFVEQYSPAAYVSSVAAVLLIAAAGGAIVFFRPVPLSADLFGAAERKLLLTGSYRTGFSERKGLFESLDAEVSVFVPEDAPEPLPLVLFATDPRSTAARSMPFAAALASRGYEVVAADFNTVSAASGLLRWKALFFPVSFEAEKPDYIRDAVMQYVALFDLYGKPAAAAGRLVFLAGEGICRQAAFGAAAAEPDIASGIYTINGGNSAGESFAVSGWCNGYGAVAQLAPELYALLSVLNHPALQSSPAGTGTADSSSAASAASSSAASGGTAGMASAQSSVSAQLRAAERFFPVRNASVPAPGAVLAAEQADRVFKGGLLP